MKRLVVWLVVLAAVAGGAVAAVVLDPAARVQGWVGGEPFFQDKSATAWRRELRQPDTAAKAAAVTALADGKAAAVPVCTNLLTAPESEVRWQSADALGRMGKDAAPAAAALVAATADPDPLVRGVAIRAVGGLAPDAPGAVPALVKQFPDAGAIESVAKFGAAGADAFPDLEKLFDSPDPAARKAAFQAVGALAPHLPKAAVASLVKHFPDVDAIRAVSGFKAAGADAIPALVKLFRGDEVRVRRQAIRAVGKTGEPGKVALPELIALITTDPVAGVREQAAEACGDIGPAAAESVPTLAKALKDSDKMVRRDAVRSLGQIGAAAKPVLADVKALQSDPEAVVKDAAGVAARLIDPASTDAKK